jgi:two-component system, NtrC family, response regulator HydG
MNLTPLDEAAIEAEYNLIVETLKKTRFNKTKAAEILQIDRKTLYNKLETYEQLMAQPDAKKKSIPGTY